MSSGKLLAILFLPRQVNRVKHSITYLEYSSVFYRTIVLYKLDITIALLES